MAQFILLLTIFSLFSTLSSALPSESILNAMETLSNSGYVAMSLTLQLTFQTILLSQSQPIRSLTIFSPPDSAFSDFGQPSFSLLLLHLSPFAFSVQSLRSLPYAFQIPTLSSAKSLTLTSYTSNDQISLNNIKLTRSTIYDDGYIVIFGIESFFDPNFTLPVQTQSPRSDASCVVKTPSFGSYSLREASGTMRASGYSVMASFLDLQLIAFLGQQPKLTIFAPVDDVMAEKADDIPEYPSLFMRHVVPCKLSWTDLANLNEGLELVTYLEGFQINVTGSSDVLMVNGVSITFPDMYHSDWVVVHGIDEMLSLPKTLEEDGDEGSEDSSGDQQVQESSVPPDRGEF